MTHPAFESKEIGPQVLAYPDLADRWRTAAQQGAIKNLGRYTAILDADLASAVRATLPNLTAYAYDVHGGAIQPTPR
ncbi:hypothetical protein [Deinococcus maricopensis]|uniref:Uncharacterized protein n=1 Tax=Deinococcus maricopensis (strain DSM 21211 / LMG 22137 / NRRL B-23946 / LB-34) TaxID=709986 RepID=E8UAW7_DEIML|nr:hypothetical protein [Deinococcus maricopensis]ADV68206.1 hypothetical protein Deima_2572 [Deinococcus maricopensis DSM 21211]